jgi:hypothetical protein
LDALVGDDQKCWHGVDAEAFGEVGSLVDVDTVEEEGAVVGTALEQMCEVALDSAGGPICL